MPTTDRVLIVEEETLLALDIETVLADDGTVDVTHRRSVAEARAHGSDPGQFRIAFVEAKLGAAEVVAFTEQLVKAGVATVVMSADRTSMELFPHAAPLEKPFDAARLLAARDAALARLR
jgi:DNA-binding NtrC family response regulator